MSASAVDSAAATSAAVSASASATSNDGQPASYKVVGILLAVGSGLLIGASFIFKKKGLLAAQKKAGGVAGEGHPYLKSWLWWTGMIIMIIGEVCNLVAYSFVDAILVTPMGSLAVVTSGVLAHFILKEKLSTFGWLGSVLCILGSIIIAMNGPSEHGSTDIRQFEKLFVSPGFLVWGGVCLAAAAAMVFFVAPRYGKKNMLVYIVICSLLGGLSVACTSGLGGAILSSIRNHDSSQWKYWFMYFLLAFCITTLLLEINYLNKALELFNTAMVTAVYYVIFTSCTLITSIILNRGFSGATTTSIINVVLGFLVIVLGVALLQLSKVDPEEVQSAVLDHRTATILRASRAGTVHEKAYDAEDPGMDTVRGFGGALGSIHRAISMRSHGARRGSTNAFGVDEMAMRWRGNGSGGGGGEQRNGAPGAGGSGPSEMGRDGVKRYQLYDGPTAIHEEPLPLDAADKISLHSGLPSPSLDGKSRANSAIKFAENDNLHLYADSRKGPDARHLEQPRLAGTHVHRATFPAATSDIGESPTGSLPRADFSGARSGSLFSSSAYEDPYANAPPASPPLSAGGSASSRMSLAKRLGSAFASSSPDLTSYDFAPAAAGGDPPASAAASGGRSRFALPPFRKGSREASPARMGAGVPHPRGPRDAQARSEEEALVARGSGRRGSAASSSDEEGEGEAEVEEGTELERFDTRDVL
ncbi:hypothetical protein JCM3770_004541 [Rhodotorula araucariae]